MNRKRGLGLVLTVVVMGLAFAALAGDPTRNDSFNYDSYSESGYRGIARILDELGFSTSKVGPTDTDDVDVLVVPEPDRGGPRETAVWQQFVDDGGLLVLGTPSERIGVFAEIAYLPRNRGRGPCTLHLARGFDDWEAEMGVRLPSGVRSCFDEGGVAPFYVSSSGSGSVLTLASPWALSNASIGRFDTDGNALPGKDQPDNAGAIAEVMSRSGSRVGFVDPDFEPLGESYSELTMWDFVPLWVIAVALQAVAALGWFAWWASRRPARLVYEPVPVTIAASELVEATGSLLRRRRDPPASASTLRAATLGRLAAVWGMPADAPAEQFVYEAKRQGVDADFVQELVDFDEAESTMTDPELVDFAQRCAAVRVAAERTMSTGMRSR